MAAVRRRGRRIVLFWVEASAERRLHESNGRMGERRDSARHLERRTAEAVDARVQELAEVGGNRELLAGSKRAASALERACKLEREERVAARGLPEPDQGRPRERRIEAGAQQLLNRAHAQAADVDRSESLLGAAALSLTPKRQSASRGCPRSRAARRRRDRAGRRCGGKTMPTFRAVAPFCSLFARDRHFVTPNHEPRRDLLGPDLGVGRDLPQAEPAERHPERLKRNRSAPTSTRLGGARQPANSPTPSLRPFNQARFGPLGIRQEKAPTRAQKRDLKLRTDGGQPLPCSPGALLVR
jgi:hypothetical protein